MSHTWYAVSFSRFGMNLLDEIQELVDGGDQVLIVDDLDSAAKLLDIERSEIVIVEPE